MFIWVMRLVASASCARSTFLIFYSPFLLVFDVSLILLLPHTGPFEALWNLLSFVLFGFQRQHQSIQFEPTFSLFLRLGMISIFHIIKGYSLCLTSFFPRPYIEMCVSPSAIHLRKKLFSIPERALGASGGVLWYLYTCMCINTLMP
jgi:hypothetical protein